jgi:hypothetical protein
MSPVSDAANAEALDSLTRGMTRGCLRRVASQSQACGTRDGKRPFIWGEIVESRLVPRQVETDHTSACKSTGGPCHLDVCFFIVMTQGRDHHAGRNPAPERTFRETIAGCGHHRVHVKAHVNVGCGTESQFQIISPIGRRIFYGFTRNPRNMARRPEKRIRGRHFGEIRRKVRRSIELECLDPA